MTGYLKTSPGMDWVADIVESANEKLRDDRHAAIGPSYFMKEGLSTEAVERIWRHSVRPYVEECLFGDSDRIREFDLKRMMAELPPRDCIADGMSRFLGISKEDAERRLEVEGGVTQADISNRFKVWHSAFRASGLRTHRIPANDKTHPQAAYRGHAFIHCAGLGPFVTVIDGEPFEACGNVPDMDRKPNHYWIMADGGNEQAKGRVTDDSG